jgi:putative spermidine/putrescine transport system ATP-binding protein
VSKGATLTLSGLGKRYGEHLAVADISLAIAAGEFVTLLGASGSGKTTTLMMVAGFVEPDAGSIRIGGASVERIPPEQRNLGVVFQSYALFTHMTVAENIAFPLRMRRVARADARDRAGKALEMVGLSGFGARRIEQLSGGQQQRVALARALVFEPPVLLMDEPLGALDRKLREQMQGEIKNLQRSLGRTVLYVTHDQEEAMVMSDRIAIMRNGMIEQFGPPAEIYDRPVSAFVADFLGESNLWTARVVRVEGDAVTLAPPAVNAPTIRARLRGPVPQKPLVRLMLRPESISILEDGAAAENEIAGTVERVDITGPTVRVFMGTPFGIANARYSRKPGAPPFTPGATLRLGWSTADGAVFSDMHEDKP